MFIIHNITSHNNGERQSPYFRSNGALRARVARVTTQSLQYTEIQVFVYIIELTSN